MKRVEKMPWLKTGGQKGAFAAGYRRSSCALTGHGCVSRFGSFPELVVPGRAVRALMGSLSGQGPAWQRRLGGKNASGFVRFFFGLRQDLLARVPWTVRTCEYRRRVLRESLRTRLFISLNPPLMAPYSQYMLRIKVRDEKPESAHARLGTEFRRRLGGKTVATVPSGE
jgi:hypothetical protein